MADAKVSRIIEALKAALPGGRAFVGLHEPHFAGNEWAYVKECLDTGWVSSVGKYVDLFEKMLAEKTGVSHAVAVGNGTGALHLCLLMAGVREHDEVLLPALTFVATPNAVRYCNATPHFVDSCELSLGVDVEKLRSYLGATAELRADGSYNKITGRRIKAMVAMHTYGHPVDLDPLADLCREYQVELIEDAAESLGSYYKGRHTGAWGKLSAVSFNGNKIATTGGGGVVLTNDARLAKLAKHVSTTAKVAHAWEFQHDMVGFNYRLPNLNAALGCAQLEQLDGFLASKRAVTEAYFKAFEDIKGVTIFREPPYAKSNYWLNVLLLDAANAHLRDAILAKSHEQKIMTRPTWTLMHRLSMYVDCPRMNLDTAESLERRIINIPSSPFLAKSSKGDEGGASRG